MIFFCHGNINHLFAYSTQKYAINSSSQSIVNKFNFRYEISFFLDVGSKHDNYINQQRQFVDHLMKISPFVRVERERKNHKVIVIIIYWLSLVLGINEHNYALYFSTHPESLLIVFNL